jgi:hypothetical protein
MVYFPSNFHVTRGGDVCYFAQILCAMVEPSSFRFVPRSTNFIFAEINDYSSS